MGLPAKPDEIKIKNPLFDHFAKFQIPTKSSIKVRLKQFKNQKIEF
jgi:hypothetical protein